MKKFLPSGFTLTMMILFVIIITVFWGDPLPKFIEPYFPNLGNASVGIYVSIVVGIGILLIYGFSILMMKYEDWREGPDYNTMSQVQKNMDNKKLGNP